MKEELKQAIKNKEYIDMNDKNEELRKAGLKVTSPRIKILELLKMPSNQHISAEDLYKLLIDQGEEIGLATVCRC